MSGGEHWERLWTPHRMSYIKGEGKPQTPEAGEHCPFCRAPGLDDAEGLVVARGDYVFVVMNLYPYNSGHVMICPYRHVPAYADLDADEAIEFGVYTQRVIRALESAMRPHGFNIGINQGAVAGAGIAAHLHQHVVPRWGGDTNFMPVVSATKVMPAMIEETRQAIVDAWEQS